MHRLATAFALVPLLLVGVAGQAAAAPPGPRPTVVVKNLTGPVPGPEGPEWQLPVDAVDRDGVIWEVQVEWGDGGVSWATTGCVQGHEPGTRAHLLIPHQYASPGRYRVRVEASSYRRCPLDGPPGGFQYGRSVTRAVVARQ